MDRVRPVTGAVTALMTAGLLAACGGEDNPISRDDTDRPLTSSSSSPAPTSVASAAPSVSASASPSTSAGPTAGAPLGSTPTGVLVQGTGFTIRLPGQPEKSSESAEGRITFDIYRYETDTATYTVTRGNYPKLGTLPTLHDAITSAAGQAGGKLTSVGELK
jgi:hypothetical protein